MGVHQNRQSKARVRRRRAMDRVFVPSLTECPQCHKMKLQHQLCPSCGYYKGRRVMNVAE